MQSNYLLRKGLAVGIIFIFVVTGIIPAIAHDIKKSSLLTSGGNWLYVGGNGPENYTHIQEAIDNATNGDTVFVYSYSSPYKENLQIKKSISLKGEQKNSTVIEAKNLSDDIVKIMASEVTFSNFSIRHTSRSGINVFNSANGISHIVIVDNIIKDTFIGITADTATLIIKKNNINSDDTGVELLNFSAQIEQNIINHCGVGIDVFNAKNTIISYNNIISSDAFGIVAGYCIGLKILNNNFEENYDSIISYYTLFLTVKQNNFVNNSNAVVEFDNSYLNYWNSNYYDDWNETGPKVMSGVIFSFGFSWDGVPWVILDLHPAKTPYDNGV